MKHLIGIPCLLLGGTEIQTLNLYKTLLHKDSEVELFCYFEHDEAVIDEFRKIGGTVRLLNIPRDSGNFAIINILRKEIRNSNPDTIHIQYMTPGALAIIAARLAGIKKILATVHQPYTKSHGRMAKIILRTAYLFTSRFITVSQNAEKSWFGSSSLFDEEKPLKMHPRHFTIYNAIDYTRIAKIKSAVNISFFKKELSIPGDTTLIGTVSRLRHEKGIDLLVEAFNLLIKNGLKAHLIMVGSGPDEKMLKKMASDYGIDREITFYGQTDWERAIQLMAIMDIVVVPSRFEGFGLTAAEAMASGKPVVASNTSGLKEVVQQEETGILFPLGDSEALKNALERLINDPDLRESFGKTGIERVKANFSLDLYRKKVKALYNKLSY